MFIVEDPMLALITRFVTDTRELGLSNDDFLRAQVRAIQEHVSRHPEAERQARALDWIEQHAERYRLTWQRAQVAAQVGDRRCGDCPLVSSGASTHCEVHTKWVALLEDYVAGRTSSREYVEEALALLRAHKSRLAVVASRSADG
jgi:hypothetical protein